MKKFECPWCGQTVSEGAAFCVNCGKSLTMKCSCGASVRYGSAFCPNCGRTMTDMENVACLVDQAKRHDERAIAQLYEMTKRLYMVTCRSVLGASRTSAEAEDVLQEAYVKMFLSLDQLKS